MNIKKVLEKIGTSLLFILFTIPILIVILYHFLCDKIRIYILKNIIVSNISPIIKSCPYLNLIYRFSDANNHELYSIDKEIITGKDTAYTPTLIVIAYNYHKNKKESIPNISKVYFKCIYRIGKERYVLAEENIHIWEIKKIKKWTKEILSNKVKEIINENFLMYDIFRYNVYKKIRNFNISAINVTSNYENYAHLNSVDVDKILSDKTGYKCQVYLYSHYVYLPEEYEQDEENKLSKNNKKRKYLPSVFYKVKIIYHQDYNIIYKEQFYTFRSNGKEDLENIKRKLEKWIDIIQLDIIREENTFFIKH